MSSHYVSKIDLIYQIQHSLVSATEFNNMKNELGNLTHMMNVTIRRFESQPSPPVAYDSGFPPSVPLSKTPVTQY